VTTGVTVHGRAFASTGAVTLDTDTFTEPTCALSSPTTTTPTTTPAVGGTPTTAAASPGGGSATTTTPGATTAPTLPGGGTAGPSLPGTPDGGPGVPPVNGPPRTGDSPLRTASFPWLTVLLAGLVGTAALGGTLRGHRHHVRRAAQHRTAMDPSPGSTSRR